MFRETGDIYASYRPLPSITGVIAMSAGNNARMQSVDVANITNVHWREGFPAHQVKSKRTLFQSPFYRWSLNRGQFRLPNWKQNRKHSLETGKQVIHEWLSLLCDCSKLLLLCTFSVNEGLERQISSIQAEGVNSLRKFVVPKIPKDRSDRESKIQPEHKKKPLRCPNCSLSFVLSSTLRRHMRCHLASKQIFKCDECAYTFPAKASLARHMKSAHSDDRPFVCPECLVSLKTSSALRVHLMTHTGEKPFTCKECSARFRHSFSLKVHLMTHTGERPYQCALCDKGFYLKRHLGNHMITHTNIKPVVCEECGARFRDNSRLKMHMRRHTGEEAFTCDLCYRKFEVEANCQKHMLTHTKKIRA